MWRFSDISIRSVKESGFNPATTTLYIPIPTEAQDDVLDFEFKFYDNDKVFIKFKNECSKTGTTEESIAIAEKIGFKTNLTASNPLDETQEVPVYFANFVLMDYGFGAVFGCPAHDQRDLDFAKKYKLNIRTVVTPKKDDLNFKVIDEAYTGPGYIFNSSFLNGLKCPEESIICLLYTSPSPRD